jgi:hypothetical protein
MLVTISPQQYLNEQIPVFRNWNGESSLLELVHQPCNMSRSIQMRSEERGNREHCADSKIADCGEAEVEVQHISGSPSEKWVSVEARASPYFWPRYLCQPGGRSFAGGNRVVPSSELIFLADRRTEHLFHYPGTPGTPVALH